MYNVKVSILKTRLLTMLHQMLTVCCSSQDMIRLGNALGLAEQAAARVAALQARIDHATAIALARPAPTPARVAFLEWTDPFFCGGHWTPEIIALAGGSHPLNEAMYESCTCKESCLVMMLRFSRAMHGFDPHPYSLLFQIFWIFFCRSLTTPGSHQHRQGCGCFAGSGGL